jgi:hypothetical protein
MALLRSILEGGDDAGGALAAVRAAAARGAVVVLSHSEQSVRALAASAYHHGPGEDDAEHIEGNSEKIKGLVLKTCFLKKA